MTENTYPDPFAGKPLPGGPAIPDPMHELAHVEAVHALVADAVRQAQECPWCTPEVGVIGRATLEVVHSPECPTRRMD